MDVSFRKDYSQTGGIIVGRYSDELIDAYVLGSLPEDPISKYMYDLIHKYDQGHIDGISVCDNINRITRKEEYIKDVNNNRLKGKMTDKYFYLPFSKSPEEIVIEWEESEVIVHFLDWIRSILSEEEWWIFCQRNVSGRKEIDIADDLGINPKTLWNRLNSIKTKIKRMIPYYIEQFGDIEEYLLR